MVNGGVLLRNGGMYREDEDMTRIKDEDVARMTINVVKTRRPKLCRWLGGVCRVGEEARGKRAVTR